MQIGAVLHMEATQEAIATAMCMSLPSICLDADRRSPAHGITIQARNNAPTRVVLRECEAAGVVHLREFNTTPYLIPASESSLTESPVTEDPMNNALICFLIVI